MRRLDSAQLPAATGRASIQLTLAGPGSGKTSTLTGRFVHLIRQGVDPARIRMFARRPCLRRPEWRQVVAAGQER
jgi:superfamily I DNA/RNA helicase